MRYVEAQIMINQRLKQYNHIRPNDALNIKPPVSETTTLKLAQIPGRVILKQVNNLLYSFDGFNRFLFGFPLMLLGVFFCLGLFLGFFIEKADVFLLVSHQLLQLSMGWDMVHLFHLKTLVKT